MHLANTYDTCLYTSLALNIHYCIHATVDIWLHPHNAYTVTLAQHFDLQQIFRPLAGCNLCPWRWTVTGEVASENDLVVFTSYSIHIDHWGCSELYWHVFMHFYASLHSCVTYGTVQNDQGSVHMFYVCHVCHFCACQYHFLAYLS